MKTTQSRRIFAFQTIDTIVRVLIAFIPIKTKSKQFYVMKKILPILLIKETIPCVACKAFISNLNGCTCIVNSVICLFFLPFIVQAIAANEF